MDSPHFPSVKLLQFPLPVFVTFMGRFLLLFLAFRVINNTTKKQRPRGAPQNKEDLPMKTKNIKVQYSSRNVSGLSPKIQMEGRWLEELGFPIGTRLMVEYEQGCIRIRPFTAEENTALEERELQAELARKQREYEAAKTRLTAQCGSQMMLAEPTARYDSDLTPHSQRK